LLQNKWEEGFEIQKSPKTNVRKVLRFKNAPKQMGVRSVLKKIVLIYKHNRLLLTYFKNQTVRQKFSGLGIIEVSKKYY
jgi:hypothetical protein